MLNLIDRQIYARGRTRRALDLNMPFFSGSRAMEVVGLAKAFDSPPLLLVLGNSHVFRVQLNGLALLGIGDESGPAAPTLWFLWCLNLLSCEARGAVQGNPP